MSLKVNHVDNVKELNLTQDDQGTGFCKGIEIVSREYDKQKGLMTLCLKDHTCYSYYFPPKNSPFKL